MLLRRITEHVKDQNWFAVFLDFFIVVVGVFMGIQVSNWNDARQEREQEAVILESLRVDFHSLDETMQHGIRYHRRALTGLQAVIEATDAGDLAPDKREAFENGLRFGMYFSATNKASGILDEILASGRLSIVQDAELRKALSEYQSFQTGVSANILGVAQQSIPLMTPFTAQFRYDVTRDHFRADQSYERAFRYSAIGDYDVASMALDPAFIEAAEELYQFQRIALQFEQATLNRIRNILLRLGDDVRNGVELE
ncbi:MAG: hypothetical protein HKN14_08485 [Marinicaulis sp.]|nr:hypothetical protein [Marinicaulis sp.]NNL87575.1 hypothetical protein [Marinicaulis sp.]